MSISIILFAIAGTLLLITAKTAMRRKDKVWRLFFAAFGIYCFAEVFNRTGFELADLWNVIVGVFSWVWSLVGSILGVVWFLIAGTVHIRLIWIYLLMMFGCFVGICILSILTVGKKADKRAHEIDGVRLAQKMKESDE